MILFNTLFWIQFIEFILDVDYRLCVTRIIRQQLWGYKVEEKFTSGGYGNKNC
jgi:hypothetical protein